MLATYRSAGGCCNRLWGWMLALIGIAEASLGLYVGNLQVLWRLMYRLWGCITYRSFVADKIACTYSHSCLTAISSSAELYAASHDWFMAWWGCILYFGEMSGPMPIHLLAILMWKPTFFFLAFWPRYRHFRRYCSPYCNVTRRGKVHHRGLWFCVFSTLGPKAGGVLHFQLPCFAKKSPLKVR